MRIIIALLVLATAGCGLTSPSEPLTGHWLANSGGRFSFIELNLQQNGGEITGTACADSDGILLYRDVPVSGGDDALQFTVSGSQTQPCCASLAGSRFQGRQDSSKDIVGSYRGVDIRFERTDGSTLISCR